MAPDFNGALYGRDIMTNTLLFRFSKSSDVPVILDFIKELAAYEGLAEEVNTDVETLSHSLFGPKAHATVLLAEVAGQPIGFCLYFYNFSTFLGRPGLYIEDIYVKPEFRGQGIGKEFFKEVAKQALAEGCGRVEWWCLDWNKPSIDFYKKLGACPMNDWTVYRLTEDQFEGIISGNPCGHR